MEYLWRDPFDLDWQAFCLGQGDLPGLVADDILGRRSHGRHSPISCRDRVFTASLEESLNSAISEHYPILTVCDPSPETSSGKHQVLDVEIEESELDEHSIRAEKTHGNQQTDFISPTEAPENPFLVPEQKSFEALPSKETSNMDQVVGGGPISKVGNGNTGNPFEPDDNGLIEEGKRTPPKSPNIVKNGPNNVYKQSTSCEKRDTSGFSRNISNPALRDKARAKLEDFYQRGDVFCGSLAFPTNSALPVQNDPIKEGKALKEIPDTQTFTKRLQFSPSLLTKDVVSRENKLSPNAEKGVLKIQTSASGTFDLIQTQSVGNKHSTGTTNSTVRFQTSASGTPGLVQNQPAQSTTKVITNNHAYNQNVSRPPVKSSITFARALTSTPTQMTQMYGLPGLDPNPPQSSKLFSDRLNPFEDSDEIDAPEDREDLTYTLAVARDTKREFYPKDTREDSPQFFSPTWSRVISPHNSRGTFSQIPQNRDSSTPNSKGTNSPAPQNLNTSTYNSRDKEPKETQISPAKTKSWWQKSSFLNQNAPKSMSPVDRDKAIPKQGQTTSKTKRFQFGQSVSLGVMRKLGMGKSPPQSPVDKQKTQAPIWNTNNVPTQGAEYNASRQRYLNSNDKTVAPVITNKTPTKTSTALDKSEFSFSPARPKSSTRIVNGVRVTGTSRRSAILDTGLGGSGAGASVRAGHRADGAYDGAAEGSGSLECSCSLYHSHHFPGQPVNKDVLARVERREDAIMTSLKLEEEMGHKKDMVETPHNIFWTPTLTFHPYRHGDALVEFPDLWPNYRELREHLQNSGIQNTVLRGDYVLDLCVLACTCGPAHLLQSLIELQLIIDQTLEDGSGLLHLAVLSQNASSVQYLVQARVSPRIRDKRGLTADQLCFSSHIRRLMAPRYVLSRDVSRDKVLLQPSLQDKDAIFKMAGSPAYFVDIQRRLQTLDFNVNTECDNFGDFLLHVAVRQGLGQLPLLMALVKIQRADIELCNADGMTALMLTAAAGNCVLTDVLICLFGADPNKPNSQSGRSALHYATEGNHRKTVECLIRRGADVNLEDHDGLRPDDIPICSRTTAMLDDCSEVIRFNRVRRLDMLAELVRKNELRSDQLVRSDFCVVDDQEYTLVMIAVLSNRAGILAMLLRFNDTTMNAQHSKTGMTALALAAQAGHKECVAILLRAGASPVISDMKGYLPLHQAVLNNQEAVVDEILEHFPETYIGLYKAIRMCKRTSIHTMLREAWEKRQEEIVTPKMLGCSLVGEAKELYLLLDEGDNINPKSGTGNWPLYLAVENGHLEVVKLLFERGGDIRKRHPTTGATVLHVAAGMGHQSVVNFLLQYCRATTPPPIIPPTSLIAGFLDSQSFQPKQQQANMSRAASFTSLVWGRGVTGGPIGSAPRLGRSGSSGSSMGSRKQLLDINAVDKDGKTAMQLAAEKGFSNIVELLLRHGSTTSLLDEQGQLITCPQFEGLRIMVERHRHNHTRDVMRLILEGKGRKGLEELRQIWLPKFDHHLRTKEGDTPLMLAAYKGRVPVLEFLLRSAVYSEASQHEPDYDSDSDADSGVLDPSLNYKSKEDFALSMDAGPILASFSNEYNNDVRPMINDWRNLNSSELVSKRVSRMVSDATKPKELSIFHDGVISHVCAVNLRNGSTALHNAVRGGDSAQCLSLLLAADRDPLNAQDSIGETVLHTACRLNRRKCVELLLTFPDLDLDIRTLEGSLASEITTSKAIVKMLEKAKVAYPAKDIDCTSLLEADAQVRPAGSDKSPSMLGSTVNFDKVHSRYEALKYRVNPLSPKMAAVRQET